MHHHKIETANRKIKRVTNLGIVGNIVLSVIKLMVGFSAGSLALIADGFHSLSDMATDVAVLLGIYFGSKQPDEKHPYGYGKAESLAGFVVSLFLLGASVIIAIQSPTRVKIA